MLIPPPEADLNQSPLVGGADIIEFLQTKDDVVIEELMLQYLDAHEASVPYDFMDSLSCLFALGLVDYKSFRIRVRTK